jgi:hypothetical protein
MEDLLAQMPMMVAVAMTSSSIMVLGIILCKEQNNFTLHLLLFFVHPEHQHQRKWNHTLGIFFEKEYSAPHYYP